MSNNLFFKSINQQGLTAKERRERRAYERHANSHDLAFAYGTMHGDAIVNAEMPRAKEAGLRHISLDSLEIVEMHRSDIRCDVFEWLAEYFDGIEAQLTRLPPWEYKVKRGVIEFVITW